MGLKNTRFICTRLGQNIVFSSFVGADYLYVHEEVFYWMAAQDIHELKKVSIHCPLYINCHKHFSSKFIGSSLVAGNIVHLRPYRRKRIHKHFPMTILDGNTDNQLFVDSYEVLHLLLHNVVLQSFFFFAHILYLT